MQTTIKYISKELTMKDIKNFKTTTTKELTVTNHEKLEEFRKPLPPEWYRLLNNFCTLSPRQQNYVLKTIENIKKYNL